MTMALKLGVVMDPIGSINIKKDSTFAMMLEAQARGWEVFYMEQPDLFVRNSEAWGRMTPIRLRDEAGHWFDLGSPAIAPHASLDVILMRKDPPFNMDYVNATYVLELAEEAGVLVVNRPTSLRDCNEKFFITAFPRCIPPTLVTALGARIREFLTEHKDIVVKPLDAMGGTSVFRLQERDPNISVVIESLTAFETRLVMAQRYIPEIAQGDKRILMVNGDPVPYALARVPAPGESRGNLAAGASGEGRPLTERDRWICGQVGPELRRRGILFAGLDVIGDYLTEINVTSPTCIRELDKLYSINISAGLMDLIAEKCATRRH